VLRRGSARARARDWRFLAASGLLESARRMYILRCIVRGPSPSRLPLAPGKPRKVRFVLFMRAKRAIEMSERERGGEEERRVGAKLQVSSQEASYDLFDRSRGRELEWFIL